VPDLNAEHEQLAEGLSTAIRFTIPFWSKVAILDNNGVPDIDLEGRPVLLFSENGVPDPDEIQGIKRVEQVRAMGAEFLIVPATASSWLQDRPQMEHHLTKRYRRVLGDSDAGAVFALGEDDYHAPDGLPMPPAEMIALVAGQAPPARFYRNGVVSAGRIRRTLANHGVRIGELDSILDFGCGCGRVVRQWTSLDGVEVAGSDYNPYLVQWCRENLEGTFETNGLAPPLNFPDEHFDLAYAFSIFTHLDEPLAHDWIAELGRVLRPGGFLIITYSSATLLEYLEDMPDERDRFLNGELVAILGEQSGSSACAVYIPESYMREKLLKDWDILEIVPGAAKEMGRQDIVLARKR
jgi:SAM-dependent methyltransferase